MHTSSEKSFILHMTEYGSPEAFIFNIYKSTFERKMPILCTFLIEFPNLLGLEMRL